MPLACCTNIPLLLSFSFIKFLIFEQISLVYSDLVACLSYLIPPYHLLNPVNIQGIGTLHSTIPVAPITTKLELIPQDLTTERVTPWFYEFFMGLTVVVVILMFVMCLVLMMFKRRAQNGGRCFLCS